MSWEVRTMPSATSFSEGKGWFSPALFRKNLARFWPLWAIYGLMWFFVLPMSIQLMPTPGSAEAVAHMRLNLREMLNSCIMASPFVGAAYGILLAMALFSYLMNNRSAGMLHALPVRREGLFFTAYANAAAAIAGPTLLVALFTLVAEGSKKAVMAGDVFKWFGVNLMFTLFFFALAVFCAMFTGHILALPVFYGIVNFLIIGICFLLDTACEVLLVGFSGWNLANSSFARWCTPIYQLYHLLEEGQDYFTDSATQVTTCLQRVMAPVCYALVLFCFLTVLALVVYQRRQLERAGDVVCVGWVRPVFQYGVGACVGLALGGFLFYIFFQENGGWAYMICVAAAAFLGALAARMLLKKTVRVFGNWKGPALCALCMFLILLAVRLDLHGFQRWVPDLDKVSSVEMNIYSTSPNDSARHIRFTTSDSALVGETLDLHRALVSDLSRLDRFNRGRYGEFYAFDDSGYVNADTVQVNLNYTLRNGGNVSRSYSGVLVTREELKQEGSYASLLQTLINEPQVQKSAYLDGFRVREVLSASLENMVYEPDWEDYDFYEDPEEAEYYSTESPVTVNVPWAVKEGSVEIMSREAGILWQAFLEDLEAGRVKRYLLDDAERMENTYYYNNLYFRVSGWYGSDLSEERADVTGITVTPEKSMTSLMAAMEKLGLTPYLTAWGDVNE